MREVPETPIPKRPFRDTAIFYAVLAVLFVVIVWATGGAVLPQWSDGQREVGGLLVATLFFFVATAYSWWRFKKRIEAEQEEATES